MAKIKKIIVNYPEQTKGMEEIQDKAMEILATSIVKKNPPEVVEKIIEKLKEDKSYG